MNISLILINLARIQILPVKILFITTFIATLSSAICTAQKAIVCGKIENTTASEIKCSFIPNSVLEKSVAITIPVAKGNFKQIVNVKTTTFLSFEEGNNYYGGFIQPGDSIAISYNSSDLKNTLSFSGKGKEKFLLADSINLIKSYFNEHNEIIKKQPSPIDYFFGKIDSIQKHFTQQLAAYKTNMSIQSFKLLNGFLQANVLRSKYNGAINIAGDSYDNIIKTKASLLTDQSIKALENLLNFEGNLSASYFYVSIVANILSVYFEDNILPSISDNLDTKYEILAKKIPTQLRSPVLFYLLEKDLKQRHDSAIEKNIITAFPIAKDSIYSNALNQKLATARALKNGIAAPDFSVKNINGETVTLSSFSNKVVYLDFWFAACGPCHKLFTDIASVKEYFRSDTNVVFLTVSIDNSNTWKKALTKFDIPGYHVFTENKYREHPIIKAYNVSQYPTTYLIGRNGKIISTRPSDNPEELRKEIANALTEN